MLAFEKPLREYAVGHDVEREAPYSRPAQANSDAAQP
jgi:hypothetical protein